MIQNIRLNCNTNNLKLNSSRTSFKSNSDLLNATPQNDTFESSKKKHTAMTITSIVVALGLIFGGICLHKGNKVLEGEKASFTEKIKKGFKEIFKSSEKTTKEVVNKGSEKASEDIKKNIPDFKKMTAEEIKKVLEKTDENEYSYYAGLTNLYEKERTVENGEKLIKYYDDIVAGKIKFAKEENPLHTTNYLTNPNNNWENIRFQKRKTYRAISGTYEKEGNYDKALEANAKAAELFKFNDPHLNAERAEIYALKDEPQKGIELSLSTLEEMKNDVFNDDQVYVAKALNKCLVKAGKNDLNKSIELLIKGSYHFENLTAEEIKFLTDKNIDYKTICGNGGREQTGAFAKWIIEQVKNK